MAQAGEPLRLQARSADPVNSAALRVPARQPGDSTVTPFAFELKDTSLPLVTVVLHQADVAVLAEELQRKLGDTPNFFDDDPVVVDLAPLRDLEEPLAFAGIAAALREHRMRPALVTNGNARQMADALEAGLPAAPEPAPPARPRTVEVEREVIREVVREVPVQVPTLVVDKPLRSGQQAYAKGGDLVVHAAVNAGAEVLADGHIHVYGPLRGKAIAGSRGNTEARIFTTCLEPELIAIAGVYRTTETPLPKEVAGKPAQVRLVDGVLVMTPLKL
jgi:septum site-determining protein MinC